MKKGEDSPDFATFRVKKVLDREKTLLDREKRKERPFSFKRSPLSIPKVTSKPSLINGRSLKAEAHKGPSQKEAALTAGALSQNQNYPLELIEKLEALQSKGIKNLELKEKIVAARRLKAMGSEIREWMYARFQWQAREMKVEKEKEELLPVPLREEERQFQINRIIPFLSDH